MHKKVLVEYLEYLKKGTTMSDKRLFQLNIISGPMSAQHVAEIVFCALRSEAVSALRAVFEILLCFKTAVYAAFNRWHGHGCEV